MELHRKILAGETEQRYMVTVAYKGGLFFLQHRRRPLGRPRMEQVPPQLHAHILARPIPYIPPTPHTWVVR